jgi:hypothetical protein
VTARQSISASVLYRQVVADEEVEEPVAVVVHERRRTRPQPSGSPAPLSPVTSLNVPLPLLCINAAPLEAGADTGPRKPSLS